MLWLVFYRKQFLDQQILNSHNNMGLDNQDPFLGDDQRGHCQKQQLCLPGELHQFLRQNQVPPDQQINLPDEI